MTAIDWMSDQVATQLGAYSAELAALDAEFAARRQPLLDKIAELQDASDQLVAVGTAIERESVAQ